ncbi:splicing factor Cactin [Armigeres subalbatus]|uniref:splicing factor Cactin n=1 Tax=Armigeres subalbatus TaxID=124917 RepID=UPI002ED0618E
MFCLLCGSSCLDTYTLQRTRTFLFPHDMWDDSEHKSATFVWQKKLEKQGLKNLSRKELEALNRKKQQDNVIELEKLKKRRLEREHQQQQREDDMYLMQRSKEVAQFEEWQRQEETFHLDQAKLRSKIRIQDGRAKPIDLLAQYISEQNLEESIEMQMHEPYTYLNGLGLDDLEDLMADIKVYNELEKGQNGDYWNDLTIIVEDELQKLRKAEVEKQRMAAGRREGIHQSVAKDVTQIFKGKSSSQLEELKKKIEDKIHSQQDGLDIGYWESLLSQLKAHMARARLRDRHQDNLRNKLEMLKKEQESNVKKEDCDDPEAGPSGSGPSDLRKQETMDENSRDSSSHSGTEQCPMDEESHESDLLNECFELYKKGGYEPKYISEGDLETGVDIVSEERDDEELDLLRQKVLGINQEDESFSKDEVLLRKEAKRGMNDDEAEFSVESRVDSQVYLWSDKYRPRKPRYFNRVHTGFEWNKYNQTHYDMDNPPPKIVQGYKFNIFYPDLINKNSTPQYFLTPCSDNPDFATLRFHAGPPYEDIAFKIVNREWEFSYKRGFRCQFHNNIFQLWFHFKRYRYRR